MADERTLRTMEEKRFRDPQPRDLQIGRLRDLHRSRDEHLYLCTCTLGPAAMAWAGGTVCPRCGHWISRPKNAR